MIEVIIILACVGALYQWRHTDFVKGIGKFVASVVLVILAVVCLALMSAQSNRAVVPIKVHQQSTEQHP